MNISSVIKPEDVILDLSVATKALLLKKLSEHAAARLGLDEGAIRAALVSREQLGSTGIGQGVAMPHAPVEGLDAPFAAMATLKKPIDFDSVDDAPVDIVFLLLSAPGGTSDYLKILAAVARKTRDRDVLKALRGAGSCAAAHAMLVEDE